MSDKLYLIVILGMIGFFIFWYQTRLDETASDESPKEIYCSGCKKRLVKRSEKGKRNGRHSDNRHSDNRHSDNRHSDRKSKKKVRFQDEESEISIDGLTNDDNDSISLDSLDTEDRSNRSDRSNDISLVDDTIDSDIDTLDLD